MGKAEAYKKIKAVHGEEKADRFLEHVWSLTDNRQERENPQIVYQAMVLTAWNLPL